ncbi:MAG: hypothetical protein F6K10_00275 [Moorea sp. SIO2B7]|nr:hypothetical protein [Moorena sp. SIO2B7]
MPPEIKEDNQKKYQELIFWEHLIRVIKIFRLASHLYDGTKSLPLDIELSQHTNSWLEGNKDPELLKKTEIALKLIDRTLKINYHPIIVIIDSVYGKNTSVLKELKN